jgi:hypothetical protein
MINFFSFFDLFLNNKKMGKQREYKEHFRQFLLHFYKSEHLFLTVKGPYMGI